MVTTLFLIRHGETEGSGEKRYKGSIDVPLSEKGIEQIKRVSSFISAEASKFESPGLSAVFSSPLGRALKSAEIIAGPHGLKPIVINDLRERSFGEWEGMTFSEIREKHPAEFDAWAANPLEHSPLGGESTIEVRDRVISALGKIMNDNIGKNIAVAAHGGVNRIILCHVMGIPLENIFRVEQDNAAINIVEFWDKYPVVKLLNGVLGG